MTVCQQWTLILIASQLLICEALAAVVAMEPSLQFPSQTIAESLNLPMITAAEQDCKTLDFDLCLSMEPYEFGNTKTYALAISQAVSKKKRTKPFWIDFAPPKASALGRRRDQPDLLTKAVLPASSVVDATAGFGGDSWLLASRGTANVTMVERDPVVAALLRDALRRLELVDHGLYERLTLVESDAVEYLGTATPDTVYLDPMFPPRRKSAAVKKNMQILHRLLPNQNESNDLLGAALNSAQSKVVVKRPVHAEPLVDHTVSAKVAWSITGKINRWDVYKSGRQNTGANGGP